MQNKNNLNPTQNISTEEFLHQKSEALKGTCFSIKKYFNTLIHFCRETLLLGYKLHFQSCNNKKAPIVSVLLMYVKIIL